MGFIKKLFSLFDSKKAQDKQSSAPKTKKGGGYYMQLEETEDTKPSGASRSAKSTSVAEALKSEPKKSPEPAAAKPQPPVSTPAPAAVATSAQAKPSPAVEPKPPSPAKKPEPVVANNGKGQPQPETTFAPHYLIQVGRTATRRPGPSMDKFREMARDVKTSKG